MQLAEPLWLLSGAIVCALLVWQYRRLDLAQRAALAQFASARLLGKLASSVSTGRRLVKRILFTLGVALLFVALARPQSGFEWQETHRKGLELLLAVDTSKSMLSQDVKPDRLARAKMAVTDLVGKLDGDAVGLIAFAGDAYIQCPITLDYDAFRECVDSLDTNVIPRGGTDIATAIHEAEAVFKTRAASEKVLVLMTDGEDLGGEAVTAAQEAAKQGVKIYTVGIGSADGALIPLGGEGFVKDDNGNFVKSHLDEATLKKMAEVTGGIYEPLGARGEGLDAIYQQGLSAFARHDLTSRQNKVPLEKFYWAVLAALACFSAEMLIGTRKNVREAKLAAAPVKTRRTLGRRPVAAGAAVVALLASVGSIHAATPQAAEQDYQKGNFAKSQREYADNAAKAPTDAQLRFNTGSAAYKAGDYAAAASAFHESLKTDQVPVQEGAYYNLGNTQFRLGEKTAQQNPQETIKTWEESLKSYDAALQLNGNDADAKHNRDLVQRKLDQLKKQEEQKKQQQQKQQNKDDQKQDRQDNKDQQNSKEQKNDSKDSQKNGQSPQQKDSQNQAKDGQESKDQKSQGQSSKDQQAKNQTGKDQQPKDQQGKEQQQANSQPKDSKDGQDPKAAAAAGQNSQAQQPAGRQASAPQPQNPPSKADPKAANPDAKAAQQQAAASEEQREPGQMTREEARQLLDSLKGDERQLPAVSQRSRSGRSPNNQKTVKDW